MVLRSTVTPVAGRGRCVLATRLVPACIRMPSRSAQCTRTRGPRLLLRTRVGTTGEGAHDPLTRGAVRTHSVGPQKCSGTGGWSGPLRFADAPRPSVHLNAIRSAQPTRVPHSRHKHHQAPGGTKVRSTRRLIRRCEDVVLALESTAATVFGRGQSGLPSCRVPMPVRPGESSLPARAEWSVLIAIIVFCDKGCQNLPGACVKIWLKTL